MDRVINENDTVMLEFENLQTSDNEFKKKCSKIVKDINEGSVTFLQLIEQLKGLLVNTLPANREKGIVILSHALDTIPNDLLASEQLGVICAFYSDRLNDHHQVIPPVLKGILILTRYKNLPNGVAIQILTSLFQNVPCQQQQQSDRLIIYKILKTLLDNKFTEILQMNIDFVYGVISAMDGERDPRNLLYLFNWLPIYLKKIPLGHLCEEMFEVIACYFPVDFRAPSQDPDTISRDRIADSLCKCLCAIPEFAEYCLPLALEKLASTLRIAKLDSLKLIAESCKVFDTTFYIQHSTDIWSQIQREVLQNTHQDLEVVALTTLETVLNKLSKSSSEIYKQILSDIIDTLKGNLLPSGKLFTPSIKIIYHTGKSSSIAVVYVTSVIIPLLINTYNITTTPAHQVLLFQNIIDLIKLHSKTHNNCNTAEVKELSSIHNLCIKAIFQEDDELKAIGLTSLAVLSESLSIDIRNYLYEYFCRCLVTRQSAIVRGATLKCLSSLAHIYSKEILQNVLNKIEVNNENLKLYLDSLISLADVPDFTEIVVSIILDHCLKEIETGELATGALKKLLETYGNNLEIHHFLIERKKCIFQILEWFKDYTYVIHTSKHKSLLDNLAQIFKILIGYQPSNVQNTIVSSTLQSVLLLYESSQNIAILFILDGLLTRIRPDVNILHDVTDFLLDCCIRSENHYIQQVAVQLLANLLNKEANEQHLQKKLLKISNVCDNMLNQGNYKTSTNVINVISWVTKALYMRSHVESSSWISRLLELSNIHEDAAKSFKTVMCDNYDCLSNSSYSNKRPLYQQKLFVEVSHKLSQTYNGKNVNCLLAFGYLVQNAPKQIFVLQFNKMLRLVIMCLEQCQDENVLCAILEVLHDLIQTTESLMEQHLQEFLPRLLKLATFKNNMQVRIKALQCIQKYTIGFPVYKLLLHKQDVLFGLTQCLDDKKRLVRKEAVDARNRWFMIDAPV